MTANAKIKTLRRDFSDAELYNPIYLPLFENHERFVHLFGGAGSGKSVFACEKEIVESYDTARANRKTLCVRKVYSTLKESLYAELKAVISDWELSEDFEILKSPLHIRNKLTGVEFIFFGLDDVEKLKSIRGVDRCLIEEATELEKTDLDQLDIRLRGYKQVQFTLCYNTISEFHWLNTEVHQKRPEDHFFLRTTWRDNIRMPGREEYGERLAKFKETNPNYYKVYSEGEWGQVVEGLIYTEYSTVQFPQTDDGKDDIQFYGLDFGFENPNALVAMHIEDAPEKQKLICKEILYQNQLTETELVAKFAELNIRKDRTIVADSANPDKIKALKQAGYKIIPCVKGQGSVINGIDRIRKYEICIAAGSKNIFIEIQNYQKGKDGSGNWKEEPAPNQVDHSLDAIRYGEQATGVQKWVISRRPH